MEFYFKAEALSNQNGALTIENLDLIWKLGDTEGKLLKQMMINKNMSMKMEGISYNWEFVKKMFFLSDDVFFILAGDVKFV